MMPDHGQIVNRLLDPDFYPHHVDQPIQHIATHISDLFLTGTYAYKLKKPVDFGFLNFTRLEARHHYCQEEIRLNNRLASKIYLETVPVTITETETSQIITLGGTGKVIDWLVKMVQFQQRNLFNNLLERHELTLEQMEDLGKTVARFHTETEIPEHPEQFGSLASITRPVLQNFRQTEPYRDITISDATWHHLRNWSHNVLLSHSEIFSLRLTHNHIVGLHGDLHLGNICLFNNKPLVFDCIEFNDSFRFGDKVSDWAFLTMDLISKGRRDLANRFLNSYLVETDDFDGLRIADFYKIYRAFVRGKVQSFLLDKIPESGYEEHRKIAARYFDVAEQLTHARRSGIVLMSGLSGHGKTWTANQIAVRIDGIVVRSDAVRKHLAGVSLNNPALSKQTIEKLYNDRMNERTYVGLLHRSDAIWQSGHWVILDATFLKGIHRQTVVDWAQHRGLQTHIVHVVCQEETVIARLKKRHEIQKDISDADIQVMQRQKVAFEPISSSECDRLHIVDSSKPHHQLEQDLNAIAHTMTAS